MKDSRKRIDLMLDTETLGTDTNSIILQVAYKSFQLMSDCAEEGVEQKFDLSVFGNIMLGRTADYDTIQWWSDPKRKDRLKEIMDNERNASDAASVLRSVYNQLKRLSEQYQLYIWCRGYDFDLSILDSAMRDAVTANGDEYKTPWDYFRKRCVRTIMETLGLIGVTPEKRDTPHDALADCEKQIAEVCEVADAINSLKLKSAL